MIDIRLPQRLLHLISVTSVMLLLAIPVFAQPDAFLPPIGGTGGGQYIARCNSGQYLTGFQLRTADDVDAIRPLCVSIYGPDEVSAADPFRSYLGGDGGEKRDIVCPSNTPIVVGLKIGWEGQETTIVNNIHLFCGLAAANQTISEFPSAVFDGPIIKGDPRPFTGAFITAVTFRTQRCPDGYIALGINGRSGKWVDSVGLICGVPRFTRNPNPSRTVVPSIGRVKTTVGSIGRVEVAQSPAYIYALANDDAGSLQWFRHDGATTGKFDWQGPRVVNTSWSDFKHIFPGGDGRIYVITSRGALVLYQHAGFTNGLGKDDPKGWLPAQQFATGWNNVAHAFSAGDGVVYAITPDGKLNWYKHAEGSTRLDGPKEVGRGWDVQQVFSIGDGIIYFTTSDGKLMWIKHNGYLYGDGFERPGSWTSAKEVGTGWEIYRQVFSTGKGIIYGIRSDGKLMWYHHKGYKDGAMVWDGPIEVGKGWGEMRRVFAQP
jgi:hypothetical protein